MNVIAITAKARPVTAANSWTQVSDSHTLNAVHATAMVHAIVNFAAGVK